jgi:hypothetical protein
MKYFLWITLLCFHQVAFSQTNSDSTTADVIGFACGKAARPSESVNTIRDLMNKQQYDSLKLLFNSTNPALKYLSIRVCQFESQKSKVVLNSNEENLILLAMQSVEQVAYCSGCTIQNTYTLKELFENKNIDLNKQLETWLKRSTQ